MSFMVLWANMQYAPVGAWLFYKFFKGIFLMERWIVPIRSCQVAIVSEQDSASDSLAELQIDSDIESRTDNQPDNSNRTTLFRAEKGIATYPNTEVPVPFTITSAGCICMEPPPNSKKNETVLWPQKLSRNCHTCQYWHGLKTLPETRQKGLKEWQSGLELT